jgi:hypothetical protein
MLFVMSLVFLMFFGLALFFWLGRNAAVLHRVDLASKSAFDLLIVSNRLRRLWCSLTLAGNFLLRVLTIQGLALTILIQKLKLSILVRPWLRLCLNSLIQLLHRL